MASYLSIPREKIDVVPLGINLDGFDRRRDSPPDRPFTVGYLARIAPEKGLSGLCEAYVRFRQMPGVDERAARSGGLSRAGSADLSQGCGAHADERRPRRRIHIPRRARSRAEDRFSQEPRRRSRFRRCTSNRRGCSCSKRWRAACRSCSRDTARFPRCSRRRLAECSSSLAMRRVSRKGSTHCGRIRRCAPSSDRTAFDGVREHYSVGRSADRMLEVYERSHA